MSKYFDFDNCHTSNFDKGKNPTANCITSVIFGKANVSQFISSSL